ncbi:MAG: methylated-DNA--[protein]-cysteine S-methyltransferase [Methylophilus sp.]|nr:methylated-DNA--[protein]-cysteine S-methyltransferase [Methylophilus sp.]
MQKQAEIAPKYDAVVEAPFGLIAILTHGMQVDILFLGHASVELKESPTKIAQQIAAQIQTYLDNANIGFNLPLVYKGTAFQRRVWSAISAIPLGQTRTYSELAAQIGSGPRAVANACGANHLPLVVPCHRVVAKNGLGGFMGGKEAGLKIKKWLLQHEGAMNKKGQLLQESQTA